jgi:hypothetical protein
MTYKIAHTEAFRHVADSYRWLAAAGCSHNSPELARAKNLIRNVDVAIQASALVYARMLIEFWAKGWTGRSKRSDRPTDIGASSHFAFALEASDPDLKYLAADDSGIKDSIDKHLSHITEYRDVNHPDRSKYERANWDSEVAPIIQGLVNLLKTAVSQPQLKSRAEFAALLAAVEGRLLDQAYAWPTHF